MAKSITCIEAMSKLQAYLDNEVGGPSEQDIDEHLHNCRECFSRAEFEKTLRLKVTQISEAKTPDDIQQRLASLIKKF